MFRCGRALAQERAGRRVQWGWASGCPETPLLRALRDPLPGVGQLRRALLAVFVLAHHKRAILERGADRLVRYLDDERHAAVDRAEHRLGGEWQYQPDRVLQSRFDIFARQTSAL